MHDHPDMLAELYEKFQFIFIRQEFAEKSQNVFFSWLRELNSTIFRAIKTGICGKEVKMFSSVGDGIKPRIFHAIMKGIGGKK